MPICKICEHDVRTVFDRQFKVNFYYCPRCEYLSKDDTIVLPLNREKEEYLTHQNTLGCKGYVDMLRGFAQKSISPFQKIPQGGPKFQALDFGSGPGDCVLAHILREELGFQVDVYDVYFAPDKVFEGKSYDLITCTEVIEHLKDPLETLDLLKKHLKPQGILALTTLFHPIKGVLDSGVLDGDDAFQDWWYRRDITHIGFFRPKTFQYIAQLMDMNLLLLAEPNSITLSASR